MRDIAHNFNARTLDRNQNRKYIKYIKLNSLLVIDSVGIDKGMDINMDCNVRT